MRVLLLVCLLALGACTAGGPSTALPPAAHLECVPFARAVTGIDLHGDGPDWWDASEGRYRRTHAPLVGAILVFRRTARLPHGHVSVVSRVLSEHEIIVTHANWVHGRVTPDDAVADVSPGNDWSVVRVWWAPSGQLGATSYPVYGFIVPERRLSHAAITAATAALTVHD